MDESKWAIGLVRTGRVWDSSRSLGEQKLVGEHLAYLGRLIEAGEVTHAGTVFPADHGPEEDGLLALIVYAASATRARELADADPAVRGGMVTLDVRPWYTAG